MRPDSSGYRPVTPDSPLSNSLHHASTTIDDLTLALTNFSRVPSPEPQRQLSCCCGGEDCETTKAWLAVKSKLESRLVLSAEVGSALLQRHEAYVRRHELNASPLRKPTQDSVLSAEPDQAEADARVAELLKENAVFEKRLMQALLDNEVAEASNKTLLHELEVARSSVSRLSAHQVRNIGLDTKLSTVLQENDDIRQERDSQTHRAKVAEGRLAALKDRTDKLQAEVRRLQDALEDRRLQHLESSELLLQDVHSKLEDLQVSHVSKSVTGEDAEVIQVIESLVVNNEMLKADNKELHKLLSESREDLQALQSEMGERGIVPPIRVETPSKHSPTSSGPTSFARNPPFGPTRRPASIESRSCHAHEPLTPETGRRPLSPADSTLHSAPKCTNFAHPQPRYPPSHLSLDTNSEPEYDQTLLNPNQATKAVQTDRRLTLHGIGQVTPSFVDQSYISPHDTHSDSSSLLDGIGSPISSLLERMHSLIHRMTQADALTLTNRLKRQHLHGADIKHLSRTTVGNILSDISHLRAQYRAWLEDDKITMLCTRKDLRCLFKLFKEILEEMGQMRVTLNDVILEPAIAVKVSEMALDPAKMEAMEKEKRLINPSTGASWMTSFSRLFNPSHDVGELLSSMRTSPRPISGSHGSTRVPRSVPKIAPALAASATTVNVEFTATGTGKSVTSIFSAHPDNEGEYGHLPSLHTLHQPPLSTQTNARNVMGIFAGAPHPDDTSDPWVVLPRVSRRVKSAFLIAERAEAGATTIGRSAGKRKISLSRDVDAILDTPSVSTRSTENSEVHDIPSPLTDRPLRRRGLSDTSIRSTFMDQGGIGDENGGRSGGPWSEFPSVLRTLGRTVQNFKQAASHTISEVTHPHTAVANSAPWSESYPHNNVPRSRPHQHPSSTIGSLIPSLTSWTAIGDASDSGHPRKIHSGPREDSGIPRLFGREGQGRDI